MPIKPFFFFNKTIFYFFLSFPILWLSLSLFDCDFKIPSREFYRFIRALTPQCSGSIFLAFVYSWPGEAQKNTHSIFIL